PRSPDGPTFVSHIRMLVLSWSQAYFPINSTAKIILQMSKSGAECGVMPPDPNEWCRKVDLEKLNSEIVKAETFMHEGVGERLVDWRYLRRALKMTGVQVSGAEDSYWLETIKGLYVGCGP
ncbi:MAG: hypothetical protein KC449_13485, partial [Anaerolineales bacterium]|nr:hypothetical protein [Anaerolineales bacterium]